MRIKRVYSTAAVRHAQAVRALWRDEQLRLAARLETINQLNTTDPMTTDQITNGTKDTDQ